MAQAMAGCFADEGRTVNLLFGETVEERFDAVRRHILQMEEGGGRNGPDFRRNTGGSTCLLPVGDLQ
jgi:hypothetical protein